MNKIVLLTLATLLATFSAIGQEKNFIDLPYIEVSGYADTMVTPNLIYIAITIAEKDTRDKISLEDQEVKMIAAFKKMGLNTELDLTTSDMLSNYKFYFLKRSDILKTKEYILKVTTAEMVARVFMQLEELGLSNTSIQKVDHSDIDELKNLCRVKAIVHSHKKAIGMTKPLGQSIGNAIHISDNEADFSNQLEGRVLGIKIRGYNSLNESKYEAPKIEFEKIKVSASVNVKYILK